MSSRPCPWDPPEVVVNTPAPVGGNGSTPVAVTAPAAPTTAPVAPAAPVCALPYVLVKKPTYAKAAGKHWSAKEIDLVAHAFRTAGLAAAYNVVPHRTKPAVRGWLQRNGLIPKNPPAIAEAP